MGKWERRELPNKKPGDLMEQHLHSSRLLVLGTLFRTVGLRLREGEGQT